MTRAAGTYAALRSMLLCGALLNGSGRPAEGQGPRHNPATEVTVVAGRLLDPRSGTYQHNVAITVRGGRIVGVAPAAGTRPRAGMRTIDLSRLTVLPGLIDAHVHLGLAGDARDNALATVRAGFTTVADLGEVSAGVLRLRDSVAAGTAAGPRILAAGLWVGTTGGICDFGGIGVRGDTAAYRRRVRDNLGVGADLIKVCVSKWGRDAFLHPDEYELPDADLGVVVDEAHRHGRRVIAHALSLAGVRAAIRARVDGLAHAAYVDSAAAREIERRGMFMIPTLASLTGARPGEAERALTAAVTLAYRLGVPIVFGTDAGVLPHGENAREFDALARAGLTPLAAVQAATTNAAKALGLADQVGVVTAGRSADLVAVDGDPLQDVSALQCVRFVMRAGHVYRDDAATPRRPGRRGR